MSEALVGLSSSRGDAPGNIREGLRELCEVGNVARNSDLYRTKQRRVRGSANAYHAVAELSTEMGLHDLVRALARIKRRFAKISDEAEALDLNVLAYRGRAATTAFAQALVLPLAELRADLILPTTNQTVGELARELPQTMLKTTVRIARTAELETTRSLDYDAPDGAGANYDELRPLTALDHKLFDAVVTALSLRPGMRVLDIGCGTGRFTTLLAQAGASVTGVDSSASMLEVARRKAAATNASIRYCEGDANRGLPPGRYDAATFFFSIQYMALQRSFWLMLRAALAAKGKMAIVTLSHRHFIETTFAEFFPSIPRIDLARFPSLPTLARILREHGFDDIVVREVESKESVAGDLLIERVARKHLSSFHLLEPQEFEAGLSAMRARLAGVPRVVRTVRAAIVSGRRTP